MLRATQEQEWWADQVVQVMLQGKRALDTAMLGGGTHLFHRIEATQSKARRQIVSDMTPEEMKKELERLQAENETLKKRSEKELSLKVSQKGGVSVYGLGRFPVTLYKEQWEKLLEMTDDIRAFIQENKAQLKTKDS